MKIFARILIAGLALSIFALPVDAKWRRKRQAPADAAAAEPAPAPPPLPGLPPPNDTARFLAGMPISARSPLAPLTRDPAWQEHSAFFEKSFAKLNTRQLNKIHNWQDNYLPESKAPTPVAYYMFSGPDFLYVDQFFPNASVYILCGKEAMGPPPDPLKITNLSAAFQNLENAMNSALTTNYFITQEMKVRLNQQNLSGTIPIFYVFLARANKTIKNVTFISLDSGGNERISSPGSGGTPGVKIEYRDNHSGRSQTMYYFTTDISDGGIGSSPGFMTFCQRFGVGMSFLKSASYLMFEGGFNRVRSFILDHSSIIVQDDSGIPIANFNRNKWNLRFFGTYNGPIELFRQHYQPGLRELFVLNNPPPLPIGFGYQWNPRKSGLIVAQRN
jgi:hypothetical protein